MNTNEELYNHLLFQFGYNSQNLFLTETRGYVSGIDDAINALLEMVSLQIETTIKTQTSITYAYTQEKLKSKLNTFFDEFRLTLTTQFDSKKSYLGEFHPKSIMEKDEKIVCVPRVEIKISANNVNDLRQVFAFACGHELTHGYNLLQYAKQYGVRNMINNVMISQNYRNIRKGMSEYAEHNYQAIANLLYRLNRMERNAYIAQLRQELLSVKDKITSIKDAFEYIKKSGSYRSFLAIEKNIEILPTVQNEFVRDNLIYATNSMMNTNFTTYNQLLKYYNRRWEKWKKNYLIKATKIAYDVFSENNLTLDGKNMNNNTTIKQ